jgi:phosphatidylglycerol:prolipoprotein diacylglycerol transferase
VRFPPGSVAYATQLDSGTITAEASHTTALHPTELYMTAGLLVAFVVLWWFHRRRPRAGTVFFAYLLLYGLVRFSVEAFRGDSARSVAGLTVSQAISLVLLVVGFVALVARMRRKPVATA